MNASSTANILCRAGGKKYTYSFTGVTAIEHNLAMNVSSASSEGSDIVNGAKNLPDRVTLSVVETDAEHTDGWAARMLEILAVLKRNRTLCTVVTSMGTYRNMLLTEITAIQDEEHQDGWAGSISFLEYVPESGNAFSEAKAYDNSSSRCNTGSTGSVRISAPALAQLLARAGIR